MLRIGQPKIRSSVTMLDRKRKRKLEQLIRDPKPILLDLFFFMTEYQIKYVCFGAFKPFFNNDYEGLINYEKSLIFIDEKVDSVQKVKTLIHELVNLYLQKYDIANKSNDVEPYVEKISEKLYSLMAKWSQRK